MIDDHAVSFLYPRQPVLHSISQRGFNWIYISWSRRAADNVTSYEVKYFYAGECIEVGQRNTILRVGGTNSSFNITGLGAYLNYSITLVAINDTGRSPPNTDFAITRSTGYRVGVVVYICKYLLEV